MDKELTIAYDTVSDKYFDVLIYATGEFNTVDFKVKKQDYIHYDQLVFMPSTYINSTLDGDGNTSNASHTLCVIIAVYGETSFTFSPVRYQSIDEIPAKVRTLALLNNITFPPYHE